VPTSFIVAGRNVSNDMQEQFAELSGDRNPIHMDPVAARRTQAGKQVVHGIHSLLWALESLAAKRLLLDHPVRVQVKFLKWVYLDEPSELSLPGGDAPNPKRLQVEAYGVPVLIADLTYGGATPASMGESRPSPLKPLSAPLDLSMEEMESASGDAYTAIPSDAAAQYPELATVLGANAISEIAACSYVVGMAVPGLHSTFSKADIHLKAAPDEDGPHSALHYEVCYTDGRFRKARIMVAGCALTGTLEVFARVPPVKQVTMASLSSCVGRREFAGMRALVIGGSRGLGEATCKIIAAGGGIPVITYALGQNDAEHVQAQIIAAGGRADVMSYDIRRSAKEQLKGLAEAPTHLFYFATGAISRSRQGVVSASILADFIQFYLHGFYDLCVALCEPGHRPSLEGKLTVLYPSSVFVEERPEGMTEYSMIKAAGEKMCEDMNLYMPGIRILIHRFPRLPTDQTATVIPGRVSAVLDAVLPLVRQMQSMRQINDVA
jgi:hypothetical protein